MLTFALFTVSGIAIASILFAKRHELRHKKTIFVLRAISEGDELIRVLHHKSLRLYSEGKERALHIFKKQLPMRARAGLNKAITILHEKSEVYLGNVRNSRLIKRSDGISEFFKSISEIEKGTGEINEPFENGENSPVQTAQVIEKISEVVVDKKKEEVKPEPPKPELEVKVSEPEPVIVEEAKETPKESVKKMEKPKAAKKPRKKKEVQEPIIVGVERKAYEPVFTEKPVAVAKPPKKRRIKVVEIL